MHEAYRPPVSAEDSIRADLALQLVAASTGIPVREMTTRERRLSLRACRGRWLSIYLAHVTYGWSFDRVSYAFGVNRATTGAACRWAEEERDRPALDGLLDRLEACARALFNGPPCELLA